MSLQDILSSINSFIWGPPLLILLSGTGLYLTVKLGLIQIFQLPRALSYLFKKEQGNSQKGDVSAFAALCTALSATIGTGNIVGVATAVQAGGPGAIFWMWLIALFGMATKYAECLLAVKYRVRDKEGFMAGGPMYYIERGLGLKWLAKLFALFGVLVAFFGIGTFPQINAITHAMNDTFNVPIALTASIMTVLVALIILGGVKRIALVSSYIVPFMAVLYVATSLIILIINIDKIPGALALIINSAFAPESAIFGVLFDLGVLREGSAMTASRLKQEQAERAARKQAEREAAAEKARQEAEERKARGEEEPKPLTIEQIQQRTKERRAHLAALRDDMQKYAQNAQSFTQSTVDSAKTGVQNAPSSAATVGRNMVSNASKPEVVKARWKSFATLGASLSAVVLFLRKIVRR